MAVKEFCFVFICMIFASGSAQTYKVCIASSDRTLCNSLDRDGSQAICEPVDTSIDCAIKLERGTADIGVFKEEELLLLAQRQPNEHRVVATVRDVARTELYAFEAVAVVPSAHSGGLEGLRGAKYCHPGLDQPDLRWSPRVLKAFEYAVARSDRCDGVSTAGKTAEELELEALDSFFGSACRPGPWSANATVDANLKTRFPSLCTLCGATPTCNGYTIDMGVQVAGVNNLNRHIQALECLRTNNNGSVAYAAWQHVKEFFTARNPDVATSFALLCPDGTTQSLTAEVLGSTTAPCAFVRQPWSAILATSANAAAISSSLRSWWPQGLSPTSGWQQTLFTGLIASIGGSSARVVFEDTLTTPLNYTQQIRNISSIDATATCIPSRRWCTLSAQEHTKCQWVRTAAYSLGIVPAISCQQRANVFECLNDIKENQADFMSSAANYGYLARQHYNLSPVKLIQNSRSDTNSFSRVAAFVKESAAQSTVTRFENLRGKKACFPEYGGIAYVAFVRAAHERGVISASECDYARAVGEFFDGACAPGAVDAAHALTQSDYNATNLCSVCKPAGASISTFTCAWDYTNAYFGNNGSMSCLNDPATDVAVLQVQDIEAHLTQLGLQANNFRALCRNNSLAAQAGVRIDDNCLLAHVVDAEVITRRNDPLHNALNTLLDTLDSFFGYAAAASTQLINLEIFSPFDGVSDLLFKDTAIGLTEPSTATSNEAARNYIELFQHLESCTGAAGSARANFVSMFTLLAIAVFTRFVVY